MVKPFLLSLFRAPGLNVGKHGTHVAMIIFSSIDRTYTLFHFGEKLSVRQLDDVIYDKLDWNRVSGTYTETGLALKLANGVSATNGYCLGRKPKLRSPWCSLLLSFMGLSCPTP